MSSARQPIILQTPNPVPVSRTPWAGDRLSRWLGEQPPRRLGECWDFSCQQQYPSRLATSDSTLRQLLATNPQAYLAGDGSCQLFIKLLCAARPLSLQLHPELASGGKHESWLAIATTVNSGGYFGFAQPFTRQQLRQKIIDGNLATSDLNFQTIDQYDYVDLPPTTVHALAPDTIVVEVSWLNSDNAGKTIRLWDWQHRYDDRGNLNHRQGKPRQLDVDQALTLFDPQEQSGDKFLATLKQQPTINNSAGLTVRSYPRTPFYRLSHYSYRPSPTRKITSESRYAVYLNLQGNCLIDDQPLANYQVVFLPALLVKEAIDFQPQTSGQGLMVEVC